VFSGQAGAGTDRQREAQEAEGYDDVSDSHGHVSSPFLFVDRLSVDEDPLDTGLESERRAVANDDIGVLPFFQRADPVGDAEDLRRVMVSAF
jgi:hypothetical protein